MAGKTVSVDFKDGNKKYDRVRDARDIAAEESLAQAFYKAANQVRGAKFATTESGFTFEATREEFMALVEQGHIPESVAAAFTKADAIMAEVDRERCGFWARLSDTFRYQSLMNAGYPIQLCPQHAQGLDLSDRATVNVTVKRYGLATVPK